MAVTAIRLQNFMGFKDTGWIELRSITLLFGKNSSGKSAIIRALLLLKQSLNAPNELGPLVFSVKDKSDLGSFSHLIKGRDVDEKEDDLDKPDKPPGPKQMVFSFRCEVRSAYFEPVVEYVDVDPDENSYLWNPEFSLSFQWNKKEERVELSALTIEIPVSSSFEKRQTFFEAVLIREESVSALRDYYIWSEFRDLTDDEGRPTLRLYLGDGFLPELHQQILHRTEGILTYTPEGVSSMVSGAIKAVYVECNDAIRNFLKNIVYLAPLRIEPQRYYFIASLLEYERDQKGLTAMRDLLKQDDSIIEELFAPWVRDLGLGQRVQKKDILKEANVLASAFELVFSDKSVQNVNIREVGFGASQVLPIISESLLSPEGTFLIVEQPELHLHPKAQVALTDLFIKQAQQGRRFFIETHSEHLLLRLQRRIAETTLDRIKPNKNEGLRNKDYVLEKQEFGLVFVERDEELRFSSIEYIQTDHRGQLDNPSPKFKHFFSYDYEEVKHITIATSEILEVESEDEDSD